MQPESSTAPPTGAPRVPATDPTRVFEFYRGNYSTELLAAAVEHFDLFSKLAAGPVSVRELAP